MRDRLDVALAGAQRHGQMLAVFFLDIDGFKGINDTHGHAAGDELLRSFADRLRLAVRQDETLARLGGDEFVLLVPTLDHPSDVDRIATRILTQLSEPFAVGASTLPITISIGVCVYRGGAVNGADIMDSADASMYQAKAAGGATYRVSTCGATADLPESAPAELPGSSHSEPHDPATPERA
jgi:diguanylate cyclase (GGDEF)-like protein